ncbi:MAG TPA: hypothetical protein H9881_04540 [Candidatus Stackebrandtia excrementipullorum]|nr:hypothetical protein [Candidatus Stackebrandtia excrementipullorum]
MAALSLFTAGLLLGGCLTALSLWLVSGLTMPIPAVWRYGAATFIAVVAILRDADVLRFPMPQNARQIPQEVFQRHLLRGSLQFGFELGTGVRTYVSSSAPYVVASMLLLSSDGFVAALVAGLGFGVGRATTPLARVISRDGVDWDARLAGRLPIITIGICSVLAAVAAFRLFGVWST